MNFTRKSLLVVTPLILTSVAAGVSAQEMQSAASSAMPSLIDASFVAPQADGVVLDFAVPSSATYAFTAPAGVAVTLRIGDTEILSTDGNASGEQRAFTTLDAGTHALQITGDNLTAEQVMSITAGVVGMPAASLASFVPNVSEARVASNSSSAADASADVVTDSAPATAASVEAPVAVRSVPLTTAAAAPAAASTENNVRGATKGSVRDAIRDALKTAVMGESPSGETPVVAPTPPAPPPPVPTPTPPAPTPPAPTPPAPTPPAPTPPAPTPPAPTPPAPTPPAPTPPAPTPPAPTPPAPTPPAPTPPAPTPPVTGNGEATSSLLSPPTGVALTSAVQLTAGGTADGVVAATGQTLFGGVMDPMTFDMVTVSVAPSGRTFNVDVAPDTGQFATRLFPEDFASGPARVTLTAASSADANVTSQPISYEFEAGRVVDGVSQALSRITYGPTADLYSRVRTIGFEAYVNEQLDPDNIRNAAFEGQDFDSLVRNLDNNFFRLANAEMSHRMAYAAFSEKQLQEVMGEFWSNHFFASTKDTQVFEQNIIDRQFFRDNAFGRFEDLLLYSARSPLMSQFLDNDQSRAGRLNENYGREILELHTVGVDAPYGDEDVIAVSRVFTGWNFRRTNPNANNVLHDYEFEFRADRHDTEDKEIPFLSTTIAGRSGAAGVQEGEELIALLASNPLTQNYVCGKIVQRFVADVPPANFVQTCVDAWEANDGDAGEILRAVLMHPEYISNVELQANKAKTPFEYAISAVRALGARPVNDNFFGRLREVGRAAGYDQLRFGLPTGLPDVGEAWVNSASMIGSYRRMTQIVERPGEYGIDLQGMIEDAGVQTAEEVAAFLLTIGTADRYSQEEYEAMVDVLKGEDGIFEPMARNERDAFERASGLLIVLPSFLLQ